MPKISINGKTAILTQAEVKDLARRNIISHEEAIAALGKGCVLCDPEEKDETQDHND